MANCILVMGIILIFTMFKFGQTGPFEQSDENANSVGNDDGDPPAHDGEDGVGEDEKGEDGNGEDSGAEVGGAGGENEGEEEEKDGPKSHGDPDQPIEGDENAHENANSGTEDGPPSEDPNKKISSEQNENHGEHQEEREEGEGHEGDHQEEPQNEESRGNEEGEKDEEGEKKEENQSADKNQGQNEEDGDGGDVAPVNDDDQTDNKDHTSQQTDQDNGEEEQEEEEEEEEGEHDGAHDTLDPGKWPYHHRLRCQRTDGHIEHIATICTNELADEVCEELFPHDHDDAARERRPKKCDLLGVDCLTKKCAKHCKICCELSAYGCGDDPKHKVSCMTQTKHTCEKMKDAMLITCAASCGLCNVGHCRDTMDDCISFREQCHDKAVKKNLRKHCARTCGFCDVHCRDKASKRTCKKLKKVCYKKAEHVRGRKRGKKLRNQARYIKSARKVCKLTCGLCHNQDINHYGSGEESSEE